MRTIIRAVALLVELICWYMIGLWVHQRNKWRHCPQCGQPVRLEDLEP